MRGDELVIAQALIVNTLGVCREGVTEGALKLQNAGLIGFTCGHITALNRNGLERRSGECYAVTNTECASLLPPNLASQGDAAPRLKAPTFLSAWPPSATTVV